MNYYKCYHAYTSWVYRLIVFVAYPLLALLGMTVVQVLMGQSFLVCSLAVCTGCMAFEIMTDHFIFGGIQAKDTTRLEYIKTSSKGKQYFRAALITDQVRRILFLLLLQVANALIGILILKDGADVDWIGLIDGVLFYYFWITLFVFISRFFSNIFANVAISYLMLMLGNIMYYLWSLMFPMGQTGYLISSSILLVLGVIISIVM